MKDLNIMTVCGFGIGSSLILKMTVDSVLEKNGIHANTEPHDVTSVTDQGVDLLLVSNELYPQVKDKVSCPILIIENFVEAGFNVPIVLTKGLEVADKAINQEQEKKSE